MILSFRLSPRMKALLGKVLQKSDVAEILDAATELEKTEDKLIESLLVVYGKLYQEYANEVLPNMREPVTHIYETGREYALIMNNTSAQREIRQNLEKIRVERDAFRKVTEEHDQLTKRLNASELICTKHQQEIERLEKKGKTIEAEKVRSLLASAKETAESNRNALDYHSEFMDNENISYQKKVVEIVTDALEKMLRSTLACLEKSYESSLAMAEQVETMEWVDPADDIVELEKQLSAVTSELEHMERVTQCVTQPS